MGAPENRLKLEMWAGAAQSDIGAKTQTTDSALGTRVLVPSTTSSSPKHPPTLSLSPPRRITSTAPGLRSYIAPRQPHPLSFCSTINDNHDATHLVFLDTVSTHSASMSTADAPRRDESFSPPVVSGELCSACLWFFAHFVFHFVVPAENWVSHLLPPCRCDS
jgi:hypothetical protein